MRIESVPLNSGVDPFVRHRRLGRRGLEDNSLAVSRFIHLFLLFMFIC